MYVTQGRGYRVWSPAEDAWLVARRESHTIAELGQALERSSGAVDNRLKVLRRQERAAASPARGPAAPARREPRETGERGKQPAAETARSFESLYGVWQGPVLGFLEKRTHDHAVAEDLAQVTWLKVWQALPQATFSQRWLYRIALNVYRDYCRREGVRPALSLERFPLAVVEKYAYMEADEGAWDALCAEVARAVAVVSARERKAFALRVGAGLSYEDVAARLETTFGAVKQLLHHGRKRVRAALVESGFGVEGGAA